MLWNPTAEDPDFRVDLIANRETAELMSTMVAGGHRAIAFVGVEGEQRGRRRRRRSADSRPRSPRRCAPTAARYLGTERREIGPGPLRWFALAGGVATGALELGIDVGGLDASSTVSPAPSPRCGRPADRAGRQSQHSLAALVAGDDQLDHWFITIPTNCSTDPRNRR